MQTHKGAAAVPDHHGNRKGYHRQRKDNRVGGVAVRAEIGSVGNENLVNDIVKRTHQKGNNAGNRVLLHEFADWFSAEKLIWFSRFF